MKKVLFVGCGCGREVVTFAKSENCEVWGIEPLLEQYRLALEQCNRMNQVHLENLTLQKFTQIVDSVFDEIVFVFPSPQMLASQMGSIEEALESLLATHGMVKIYTEIVVSTEATNVNGILLQFFLAHMEAQGWDKTVNITQYDREKPFVKQSDCGRLFHKNGMHDISCIRFMKKKT